MTSTEAGSKACSHSSTYTTTIGFEMCADCERIIKTPKFSDLKEIFP